MKASKDVSHQLISVEFVSAGVCDQFLEKVSEYRNTLPAPKQFSARLVSTRTKAVPIFIARRVSQETKRLRWLAMQKKTALGYKYCWISKAGILWMKKADDSDVINIKSEDDLL